MKGLARIICSMLIVGGTSIAMRHYYYNYGESHIAQLIKTTTVSSIKPKVPSQYIPIAFCPGSSHILALYGDLYERWPGPENTKLYEIDKKGSIFKYNGNNSSTIKEAYYLDQDIVGVSIDGYINKWSRQRKMPTWQFDFHAEDAKAGKFFWITLGRYVYCINELGYYWCADIECHRVIRASKMVLDKLPGKYDLVISSVLSSACGRYVLVSCILDSSIDKFAASKQVFFICRIMGGEINRIECSMLDRLSFDTNIRFAFGYEKLFAFNLASKMLTFTSNLSSNQTTEVDLSLSIPFIDEKSDLIIGTNGKLYIYAKNSIYVFENQNLTVNLFKMFAFKIHSTRYIDSNCLFIGGNQSGVEVFHLIDPDTGTLVLKSCGRLPIIKSSDAKYIGYLSSKFGLTVIPLRFDGERWWKN